MAFFDNKIMSLFSLDLFMQMAANEEFNIIKLNALTALLINNCIPFDSSFKTGSRREAPSVEITIYINPTTTLVFDVQLGKFSGNNNNLDSLNNN